MKKEVILVSKQGFCYGVTRSIQIALDVVENNNENKEIHLLGRLVHNQTIGDYLSSLRINIHQEKTRLEMIDTIDSGIVISTAHGIGNDVYKKINEKELDFIDTTCPNVKYVYNLIKNKLHENYSILYICNKFHPEAEAVKSFSNKVYLLDNTDNIPNNINGKILVVNQTTVNVDVIKNVTNKILNKYPNIEILNTLCKETIYRQKELDEILSKNNNVYVIIIGDKKSHNTNSLYEIAIKHTDNVIYILDDKDENLNKVIASNLNTVVIASGTSTPIEIVNKIIDKIK